MSDYERIAFIIRFLDEHPSRQPDLATLAGMVGLSSFHFHRLFSRWAGITPKDFLQCLTLTRAKEMLRRGATVLDAALDTGLSGPGRLHDLCVTLEAASPGELKTGGASLGVEAGFAKSPFGTCLVGHSQRGICHLSFIDSMDRKTALAALKEDWPHAQITWNDSLAAHCVSQLFTKAINGPNRPALRAFVRGSRFQVRVWRALLCVPPTALVSYGDISRVLGNRSAARAVGSAIAQNPLAYLIPCHRVIRQTGALGGYRWGTTRKRAIIAWETLSQSVRDTPHAFSGGPSDDSNKPRLAATEPSSKR